MVNNIVINFHGDKLIINRLVVIIMYANVKSLHGTPETNVIL